MNIKQNKILVVGDLMLDIYEMGTVSRISPEAPVPVFSKYSSRNVLGGAANVATNLLAAQQSVSVCGVLGDDEPGEIILDEMTRMGVEKQYILRCKDRRTTTKTRVVAQNSQQLIRIDEETVEEISDRDADVMIGMLRDDIKAFDLIILSDYKKGLLTPYFCRMLITLSKANGIKTLVDVKDKNLQKYAGSFLLKPNKLELSVLSGVPLLNQNDIKEASRVFIAKTGCDYVLTTLGADGMYLYGKDGSEYREEADRREVYDVSGAGDTAIAYLTAGMASGFCLRDSVHMANLAAGIKVTKQGTSPVQLREVLGELLHPKNARVDNYGSKVIRRDELDHFRHTHEGQRIVFTNGCFDIIHSGHIAYLNKAAKLGDMLIVGLNSDQSVRRLKGESRPVNSEQDRAAVLAALRSVDYVVIFEEDTPLSLIQEIKPNVLVKGGDYVGSTIVGADFVRHNGGVVVTIPLVEGKSTTNIINAVKKS